MLLVELNFTCQLGVFVPLVPRTCYVHVCGKEQKAECSASINSAGVKDNLC